MTDEREWFAPKRYGIGAGVPISWQGWAVTLAYVAIVAATAFRYRETPLVFAAILVPVTAVFLVIAARTTRGGWRWRWGGEE
jgi:tetrahydromethanopterin S-methyltransferase subunit C